MKSFFKKHSIVLIALCAVLGIGILSGAVLFGAMRLSMRDIRFSTVAQAHVQTEAPVISEASAAPTVPPLKLSASTIADIVANTDARRKGVIPHRTEKNRINDGKWEAIAPDDARRAQLLETADALTVTLFGQNIEALTGSSKQQCSVTCLKDTTGYRDTIAVITDAERLYRLTLREQDGGLLNADLLVFPEHAADPSSTQQDAERIARALGMQATMLKTEFGSSVQEGHLYSLCDKTGTCVTVLYYGDRLTQVAVYPDAEAMYEDAYFLADVRFGNMEQSYPIDFSEPEEPTEQHERLIAERFARTLSTAEANITGGKRKDPSAYTVTVQHDQSGAREDIFVIEDETVRCTVSRYSRNIITMTCEWPCPTIVGIPYEQMGGDEYMAATWEIASTLLSRMSGVATPSDAFDNAVYDGHACTMDVLMSDGTFYELVFHDGVLTEIRYYANEDFMNAGVMGWVANNVYTNAVTGERIIPTYPEWDGDLHIKRAPN